MRQEKASILLEALISSLLISLGLVALHQVSATGAKQRRLLLNAAGKLDRQYYTACTNTTGEALITRCNNMNSSYQAYFVN